jgi:hypothetical protein
MERIAKAWNTISMALFAIAILTAPFRGFSGGKLLAALIFGSIAILPLALAAISYRQKDRHVPNLTYFSNLGLLFVTIALLLVTAFAEASVSVILLVLLVPLIGAPTLLNVIVLRRRRLPPNTTPQVDARKESRIEPSSEARAAGRER